MGDLILPHYKNDNLYHHTKINYEIPKNQQILFPIDTDIHYKDEQTFTEAKLANLMRISKALPHVKVFKPSPKENKTNIPFDYKNSETNISKLDFTNQKNVIQKTLDSYEPEKKNLLGTLKIPYKKLNFEEQGFF